MTSGISLATETTLECPQCEYNLTGLRDARCPECGLPFDPDELRKNPVGPPKVAFERAKGWVMVPAFVLTWLTTLFAGPAFAAQVLKRGSVRHAALFAAACFAITPLSVFFGADVAFIVAWLATAAVYLALQTVWLSVVAPAGGAWRGASWRYWLIVGFYTSAVVPTEITNAPPIVTLASIADLFGIRGLGSTWTGGVMQNDHAELSWAQILLWLAGVAACAESRFRARRLPLAASLPLAVIVALTIFLLYAATIEHVGARIYQALD